MRQYASRVITCARRCCRPVVVLNKVEFMVLWIVHNYDNHQVVVVPLA
jgi:hypothetical protein